MKSYVVVLILLVVLLIPSEAWVWTQVRHGEAPKYSVQTYDSYCVAVVGHNTNTDQLAAAGVVRIKWESQSPVKRRNEMLALRTAFLDWFVDEWVRQGGARDEAIAQVRGYPFQTDPQSGLATPTTRCD